jgi:hypothetical protein
VVLFWLSKLRLEHTIHRYPLKRRTPPPEHRECPSGSTFVSVLLAPLGLAEEMEITKEGMQPLKRECNRSRRDATAQEGTQNP